MGENIAREPDDWQRMLVERTRTMVEKRNGLKRVESRGEGEVAWGEEKRKSRGTEKQTWRRWGIDEAESWVIPAVNLCLLSLCVCAHTSECEYEWWTMAVNETVYQINMVIISQMTMASIEEHS